MRLGTFGAFLIIGLAELLTAGGTTITAMFCVTVSTRNHHRKVIGGKTFSRLMFIGQFRSSYSMFDRHRRELIVLHEIKNPGSDIGVMHIF